MATKITERAVKVAEGIIPANGTRYTVYADFQVGQRVKRDYANRYWLLLNHKGRKINQSTQKPELYAEWMEIIAANGVAA